MQIISPDSRCSLTWGVLQERITTTNYGTEKKPEVFKYPVVMNTVQSTFAALLGYVYVLVSRKSSSDLPIFPSRGIVWPLVLVAITSAVSSPFGYASLQHVDYITFILAKSCKLLPVMLLHVTLYRRKYPFYKYAVVALVTSGVAIFTVYQSGGSKKKKGADGNSLYGLMLLGINLLFDGLTNSTQDDIYARFRPYTGRQMMCALNMMSTVLTSCFLLLSPYIVQSGLGAQFGMDSKGAGELGDALAFVQRHPAVGWDILGFAACGAMGQVFICASNLSVFVFLSADIENSHDPLHLRQPPPRHGNSHEEDAHDDHLGRLVRPFSDQHAMARRGPRLWRHWDRSRAQQAREESKGTCEAEKLRS
jgi:solute carrier family 35 (UDP-galactose transporter), member B1